VLDYLGDLERPVSSRCDKGNYYLVNNYNPGYFGDGSNAYTDPNAANTVYTIPPSTVRTLGDLLIANRVSLAYYGDQGNLSISRISITRTKTTCTATSATYRNTQPRS
jgi:phospholipase C